MSRFWARMCYFGQFQARIPYEAVVFGRLTGRIDRIQNVFEKVWVTLVRTILAWGC